MLLATVKSARNDEKLDEILRGRMNSLPEKQSKIITIFLSSTFKDWTDERDYLIENKYKELKDYCKNKYQLDFQVVEMRWGIKSSGTKANLASQFCISEVERCMESSAKPCFIGLLSYRYGYIFAKARINADEFSILKAEMELTNKENLKFSYEKGNVTYKCENIIDKCYKIDLNKTPLFAVLLDLKTIFINYSKNTHYDIWYEIERRLVELFQLAAVACLAKGLISKEQRDKYFISITEEEIHYGVLSTDVQKPQESSLIFIRDIEFENIENAAANKEDPILSSYIELNQDGTVNKTIQDNLNNLKLRRIPDAYKEDKDNIINLTKIKFDKRNGVSRKTHAMYMREFGDSFIRHTKRLIDLNQSKKDTLTKDFDSYVKELVEEVLNHSFFCQEIATKIKPQPEYIQRIISYVKGREGNPRQPLVICGASGCGKTSLIAKVAYSILDSLEYSRNYTIILRFLGTTPYTSTVKRLFKSLIWQLSHIYNVVLVSLFSKFSFDNFSNTQCSDLLIEMLNFILKRNPHHKIIFFLDSLDQLEGSSDLEWLPRVFPDNVKFIYSVASDYGTTFDTLVSLKITHENFLEVKKLNPELALQILKNSLSSSNSTLQENQWDAVKRLFNDKNVQLYPLYIKLIFDIVSDWYSFSEVSNDFFTLTDIDRCIEHIFKMLEIDFGKLLVSRCLFYLSSNYGISDVELEDVLSLDDELLNDIFEFHEPPIRRFPITLWNKIKYRLKEYITAKELQSTKVYIWYHRKFLKTAKALYVNGIDKSLVGRLNYNLLDVFNETWKDIAKPFRRSSSLTLVKAYESLDAKAKRNTSSQPIKFESNQYNLRRIRKVLEVVLVQEDFTNVEKSRESNRLLVENVFLNYDFFMALCQIGTDLTQFSIEASLNAFAITIRELISSAAKDSGNDATKNPPEKSEVEALKVSTEDVTDLAMKMSGVVSGTIDKTKFKKMVLKGMNSIQTGYSEDYIIYVSLVLNYIYQGNFDLLVKYPNSMPLQMCSRLLQFYGRSDLITQFIDQCDIKSPSTCSLIAAYQSEPLSVAMSQLLVNVSENIEFFQTMPYRNGNLECLLCKKNIFLLYWNKLDELNKVRNVAKVKIPTLSHDHIVFKAFLIPYLIGEKGKEEINMKPAFLVASKKDVVCVDTHSNLVFTRHGRLIHFDREEIRNILLMGYKGFIVEYQNQEYFDVHDTTTGESLDRRKFKKKILSIQMNRNPDSGWIGIDHGVDVYVAVLLEQSEVVIFHVSRHCLREKGEIKFNFLYQRTFLSDTIYSIAFNMTLSSKTEFKLFGLFKSTRCFLIQRDANDALLVHGIKADIKTGSEMKIVTCLNGLVILKQDSNMHIYDTAKKVWHTLEDRAIYDRIVVDEENDYYIIYGYKNNYIDAFLFKPDENFYKITDLFKNLSFSEEICGIVVKGQYLLAILKGGILRDLRIYSAVIAENLKICFSKSANKFNSIKAHHGDRILTHSNHNGVLSGWDIRSGDIKFELNTELENVLSCIAFGNSLFLFGKKGNKLTVKLYRKNERVVFNDEANKVEIEEIKNNLMETEFSEKLCVVAHETDQKIAFATEVGNNRINVCSIKFILSSAKWVLNVESIEVDNYFKENSGDVGVQRFGLTELNDYLIIVRNNDFICIDVEKGDIKYPEHHFDETSLNVQMVPIPRTDDFILLRNETDFNIVELTTETLFEIKLKNKCHDISLNNNFVCLESEVEGRTEIMILDLMSVKKTKVIETPLFTKTFTLGTLKHYTLTPSCEYLVTYESIRVVSLFRLKDKKLLAQVPICSPVTCLYANDEFVVVGNEEQRIVSYSIVDPDNPSHPNRITQLPSRNKKVKLTENEIESCLNILCQINVGLNPLNIYRHFFIGFCFTDENLDEAFGLSKNTMSTSGGDQYQYNDAFKQLSQFFDNKQLNRPFASSILRLRSNLKTYEATKTKAKLLDLPTTVDANGKPLEEETEEYKTKLLGNEKASLMCELL